MYKDKALQKKTTKERVRRYREGMTVKPGEVVVQKVVIREGMTEKEGMMQYSDIIGKLTDPVWRPKLECTR